jgi:long-chain acyl-CoA synthetase
MDKIWLKSYPKGVPATIEDDKRTLNDLFNAVCKKYPNNRAFTCDDVTITYSDTSRYVNNLASSLIELGVKHGDRVAVIMPNVMQYPLSIFAILKIGAIVVNVNPLYTPNEIDYLLENSGAKVVIVLDMMAGKLNSLYNKHNVEHVIVTKYADLYPFVKRNIFNLAIKYIKRTNVSYSYKAHDFRDLVSKDVPDIRPVRVQSEDIAFIQFTGATTGKPKGAMLLHRSIVSNLNQIHSWLTNSIGQLNKEIVIDALPLYHIFSLTANLFTFFFEGSENIMVPNPRDVPGLVKILLKSKFTVFSALDTLYNHLLNSPEFTSQKFPDFKFSVAGGMPARQSVADKWTELTNVIPSNCYGMTEASPAVTMNINGQAFDGSVGYPIPSTELEIRDIQTGIALPQGETGVVWVRGPQLMKGYWNDFEQTKQAFDDDGWFNTKDLGYLNENGKLFLSGRQSEMVIVSGFNVYPAEIELLIDGFKEIKESAVIGVPDSNSGEAVVAFVVFKSGLHLQEADIIAKCKQNLTAYKVPKHIHIVEELPKTLVGKIDKVALARKFVSSK